MAKPFDISKLRKKLTDDIEGLSVGFRDPKTWISTGNYTLNYLISKDFTKGVPLGKVTMFAGETGCLPDTALVSVRLVNMTPFDVRRLDVTVGELKEIYQDKSTKIEILTPDGYQPIGQWFDKGIMPMVMIATKSFITDCAETHALQKSDQSWILAKDVKPGDVLITKFGNEKVESISSTAPKECFDFEVLHENHRYYGDGFSSHNSGKSYIASGNIIKNAQDQGIFVILIDTENALDEAWLQQLGVKTDDDHLLKLSMSMIDDVAKTISEFMKSYKTLDEADRPKVLFVIDSLGMLMTPTDVKQFEDGELKGDLGRKPKALAALVRNCVNMFGNYEVGMVATNHTYASQDPYNPDPNISGGSMFQFASSIIVATKKLKLKEDEEGNKVPEVRGIRCGCKVMKTRYNKPFEDVEVQIPYDTGMNPTSGLFDLFEKHKMIVKEGNRYIYTALDGTEHKYFRKEYNRNENGILDLIMKEFQARKAQMAIQEGEDE